MTSSQKITLIVGAVVVFAAVGYQFTSKTSGASGAPSAMVAAPGQNIPVETTTLSPAPVAPSPTPAEPTASTAAAKTVTTIATYKAPPGDEKVGFTLILDRSGVITDATTQILGISPVTKMRQEAFAKALPEVLKGKKLSELTHIDRVGGSSLTTGAFNQSLAALKAE